MLNFHETNQNCIVLVKIRQKSTINIMKLSLLPLSSAILIISFFFFLFFSFYSKKKNFKTMKETHGNANKHERNMK